MNKVSVCRDGPSQLVTLADDNVWQLDSSCVSIPLALQQLMQDVGASNIVPGQNCGGAFSQPAQPELPKGTSCVIPQQQVTAVKSLLLSQSVSIAAILGSKLTLLIQIKDNWLAVHGDDVADNTERVCS